MKRGRKRGGMSKAHLVEVVMAMRADGYGQAVIAKRTGFSVRYIRLMCAEFGIGKGRTLNDLLREATAAGFLQPAFAAMGNLPPVIAPCMPVVSTHGESFVCESEVQSSTPRDVTTTSS